jgi:hypothetical protein
LTVENDAGDSIPASPVDSSGNPLGEVTLTALINGSEGFVIRPGQPASLTIDFDLEASNEVTIAADGLSAEVSVNPVLILSTEFDGERDQRLRGLLDSVDTAAQTFVVDIRPFRHRHHSHGEITVNTDADTMHEVDGIAYDNENGLAALAALDPLSPIVVLGVFDPTDRSYLAREVYAGSSVPWDSRDILKGSIIARAGDQLTLLGAVIEHAEGHYAFNDEILVTIDADTVVTRQGSLDPFSGSDISVGQRVTILGDMTDDSNMDASGSEGLVRMRYSDIRGSVVSVSPLEVALQDYNRRNVDNYDFSGTGIDAANDADPAQYQVDSGNLPLDGLELNGPVKLRGFPTPFGSAPLDFSAKTLADVSQVHSNITVLYGTGNEGAEDAIASLDDSGLLLDLTSATRRHHLSQAGVITDLNSLASMPLIQPTDGLGLYVIQRGFSIHVYTDWSEFVTKANEILLESNVIGVHSHGKFDSVGLIQTSHKLVITFSE